MLSNGQTQLHLHCTVCTQVLTYLMIIIDHFYMVIKTTAFHLWNFDVKFQNLMKRPAMINYP